MFAVNTNDELNCVGLLMRNLQRRYFMVFLPLPSKHALSILLFSSALLRQSNPLNQRKIFCQPR